MADEGGDGIHSLHPTLELRTVTRLSAHQAYVAGSETSDPKLPRRAGLPGPAGGVADEQVLGVLGRVQWGLRSVCAAEASQVWLWALRVPSAAQTAASRGLLLRPVTRPAASAPQPVGPDELWPLPEERAFSVKWQGTPQDRPRAASEMPGRCVTGDSPVTHTPHLPSPGRTKGPDFRLTCFCLHQSKAGTFVRPVSLKAMGTCWHLSAHDQLSVTR